MTTTINPSPKERTMTTNHGHTNDLRAAFELLAGSNPTPEEVVDLALEKWPPLKDEGPEAYAHAVEMARCVIAIEKASTRLRALQRDEDERKHLDPAATRCGLNGDWSVEAWSFGPDAPNTGDGLYVLASEDENAPYDLVIREYDDETGDDDIRYIGAYPNAFMAYVNARAELSWRWPDRYGGRDR